MADKIRWGILGTGRIAGEFATGLTSLDDAELVAVGSRKQETADAFGEKFLVPRRHPTYEALAADEGVDAIYVATPHPYHKDSSILCLEAGRAVLCEKPFTINAAQAREVVEVARSEKRFLMEAMWTRFLPVICRLRELLAEGKIGEVHMLYADFGFRAGVNPEGRLFNLGLGGGALLDVGVYPVSLSSMIFGGPKEVAGLADLGETGVDERSAYVLRHEGGELSVLSAAIRTSTPQCATIVGTEGRIALEAPWWRGTTMTVYSGGDAEGERIELPYDGNGYNCEAAEVGRCLREGRLESEVIPLDESISIMETMDEIRAQWGLTYPME